MVKEHRPHRTSEGRQELRERIGGRPPRFSDPAELERLIDLYFETCDSHTVEFYNKKLGIEETISKPRPYTMTGLVRALGFRSRNALLNYEGKPEFAEIIADARLRIEEQRNEQLIDRSGIPAGIIFDLKNNHGWRDESSVEVSGPDGGPIQVGLVGMPPTPKSMEEWTTWYNAMTASKAAQQEAIDADYEALPLPSAGEQAGELNELRSE